MSITSKPFGQAEGKDVSLFTLSNAQGTTIEITNFGGIIVSIKVADKQGNFDDVVLGFDNLERYTQPGPYFGAVIGRHANRIENSEFTINGTTYHVAPNEGKNHLHGGIEGFDKVVWDAEIIPYGNTDCLQLSYLSKDGEEGYPGNLSVKVLYYLTEGNTLHIEYIATTDKDTVVNLTNHSYFNLSGHNSGDVLKHELRIQADKYTVVNNESIPIGEIADVKGTPLDFTVMKPVGQDIDSDHEQIVFGGGFDHNWVLDTSLSCEDVAAEVYDPESGRVMLVYTSKPGVQFYSANFLDGVPGKGGASYEKRGALCLETQYFPNALNHEHFPSPILKVGEEYRHKTMYQFTVK